MNTTSTAPPPNPTNVDRPRPMLRRRLITGAAVGGVFLGAAAGAAGLAAAATSSSTPAPGTPAAGSGTSAPTVPGPGAGSAGKGGKGGKGNDGTVTAINGSSITVSLRNGAKRNYTLTSSTTYHRGPVAATRSNLAAGEHVRLRVTDPTASTPSVADVDIIAPHIDGTITALGSDTITVTDPDGFTRTIHTGSATTYTKAGTTSSRSALSTGTSIHASGTVDADHTSLDAATVDMPATN